MTANELIQYLKDGWTLKSLTGPRLIHGMTHSDETWLDLVQHPNTYAVMDRPDRDGAMNSIVEILCREPAAVPDTEPSLRDQFAMAALQGLMVNTEPNRHNFGDMFVNWMASGCYKIADAMLKERGGSVAGEE